MISRELIRKIRYIEISTNRTVNDILAGEYQSVFRGRGMEFEEVREYQPGDDVRTIDWNVTARTGRPFVKRYVEERELTVIFLIDLSASGTFGSIAKSKNEIAAELCALLSFAAIRNNDRVGLIVFTDEVEMYIPPDKGSTHVLRLIRELLTFSPRQTRTDIAAALDYLGRVIHKRAVVFLVSDFQASGYERQMRITAKRHDLIAAVVADRRELDLPDAGLVELEDAETGEIVLADTLSDRLRRRFAAAAQQRLDELAAQLRSMGVDHIPIRTEGDYLRPVIRFFKNRERR